MFADLDAPVSAGRRREAGAVRFSSTRECAGSAGIRDEVRPEAPNRWARNGTRNRPALLQSGLGPGEAGTPGRGPTVLVKRWGVRRADGSVAGKEPVVFGGRS